MDSERWRRRELMIHEEDQSGLEELDLSLTNSRDATQALARERLTGLLGSMREDFVARSEILALQEALEAYRVLQLKKHGHTRQVGVTRMRLQRLDAVIGQLDALLCYSMEYTHAPDDGDDDWEFDDLIYEREVLWAADEGFTRIFLLPDGSYAVYFRVGTDGGPPKEVWMGAPTLALLMPAVPDRDFDEAMEWLKKFERGDFVFLEPAKIADDRMFVRHRARVRARREQR